MMFFKVSRIVMAGVEPGKLNMLDSAESAARDLKELQYHENFASRLKSSVEINIASLTCMTSRVSKMLNGWGSEPAMKARRAELQRFSSTLERIHQEQVFALKNITAAIEQVQLATSQLRDTISLRNSEITKIQTQLANENSEITKIQTELANKNSEAIVAFSKKANSEAHVVKTLTVLALFFVPASFVAVSFSPFYTLTLCEG